MVEKQRLRGILIGRALNRLYKNRLIRWLAPRFVTGVRRRREEWKFHHLTLPPGTGGMLAPENVMIWVPKTAGSSLFTLLSSEIGMKKLKSFEHIHPFLSEDSEVHSVTFGHIDTDSLIRMRVLSPDNLENAYTFGFVRNPYSRVVSLYRYLIRVEACPPGWSFDYFVNAVRREKPVPDLSNVNRLSQAAPMTSWMRPTLWRGPTETFFFEDMAGAMKSIETSLGIEAKLPYVNAAGSIDHSVQASEHTIEIVRELYHEDFVAFGYPDTPPSGLFAH